MITSLARVMAVGFVLGITIWLALVLVAGYRLNGIGDDGGITVGHVAAPFATATRTGDSRTLAIAPAGYALGSAPAVAGLGIVLLRPRAPRLPRPER